MNTKFIVAKINDIRKKGSEIALNRIFIGRLSKDKKKVYYTDNVDCDWCFYVGDTCSIVQNGFENKEKLVHYITMNLPIDLEFIIVLSDRKLYIENPDCFIRNWEKILYKGTSKGFRLNSIIY